MATTAWIAPKAFAPVWKLPLQQNADFPRKFINTMNGKDVPIIGDENSSILTRVVQPDWENGSMILLDPFTREVIRQTTNDEQNTVGDSPYAIEHYGKIPDRQLMLTFDDGPDPIYTAQIRYVA